MFDRFGPRVLYVFGLACFGLGFTLAGFMNELWQFWLCVGVLGGFGVAALGMIPATALIRRWFDRNLTTATSIASAGLGSGTLVLAPLSQVLIDSIGWRDTYFWLGIGLLALVPPVLFLPWGRILAGNVAIMDRLQAGRSGPGISDFAVVVEALKTRAFWVLFCVFMFTGIGVYVLSLQSVAFLVANGFPPLQAASAFGVTGSLSIGGMLAVGIGADRFGKRLTATISYAMTLVGAASLWCIGYTDDPVLSWGLLSVFVVLFGLNLGSRGPIITTVASQVFGTRGFGAIYGAITAGQGFGAGIGSWAAGALFDYTGGYFGSFVVCYVFIGLSLLLFWTVPELKTDRVRKRGPEKPPSRTE